MREIDGAINDLSRQVIGAAIEVHRILGPGYLESVYEEALATEMKARGIEFKRQFLVPIQYKSHEVGNAKLDFLVADQLVLELKAVDGIAPIHKAQVISYLRALKLPLGLLMNFNVEVMRSGIHRVILSTS